MRSFPDTSIFLSDNHDPKEPKAKPADAGNNGVVRADDEAGMLCLCIGGGLCNPTFF